MDFERYAYADLLAAVKETPTQENIDNLARWLERYDASAWNGEHLNAGDGMFLVPIYKEDEDGELEHSGHWEIE